MFRHFSQDIIVVHLAQDLRRQIAKAQGINNHFFLKEWDLMGSLPGQKDAKLGITGEIRVAVVELPMPVRQMPQETLVLAQQRDNAQIEGPCRVKETLGNKSVFGFVRRHVGRQSTVFTCSILLVTIVAFVAKSRQGIVAPSLTPSGKDPTVVLGAQDKQRINQAVFGFVRHKGFAELEQGHAHVEQQGWTRNFACVIRPHGICPRIDQLAICKPLKEFVARVFPRLDKGHDQLVA
mmetsp:Transcript_4631/g.10136  ORF Transcript_4631/g.10136 Transcript_4631/m.10136 type:complete len:236 (+) Transcript_4631:2251-2958(+)